MPISVELFYSYAHQDEAYRVELEKWLAMLRRNGVITTWSDRRITSGDDWKNQIDERLERAHVILCLLSVDFLASNYAYDIELARALERRKSGDARVIPVIVRPCLLTGTALAGIQ